MEVMRGVLVVVLVAVGCGQHVELRPLPPALASEQRLGAFQQLREGAKAEETITTCFSNGGCASHTRPVLVLANGEEIREAEDVEPVVDPGSTAGIAVQKIHHRKRIKHVIQAATVLAVIVGGYTLVKGFERHDRDLDTAGAIIGVIGGLGGLFAIVIANDSIAEAQRTVFAHYDEGLAARLQLCVNGLALVPCENRDSPGIPLARPDPALRALPVR